MAPWDEMWIEKHVNFSEFVFEDDISLDILEFG